MPFRTSGHKLIRYDVHPKSLQTRTARTGRFGLSLRKWMRHQRKRPLAAMRRKEMPAQPFVFKDVQGNYRWVLLSSNGFRDRDGEIVSTKGLERDVALWELDGRPPSPLRFWHVALDDQHKRGLELGYTDWRMVHGHTLIETGTFISKEVGEAVFAVQDKLGASVGFRHSPNEPDQDKIYGNVEIFERSLLPREHAANPLTYLVVQ